MRLLTCWACLVALSAAPVVGGAEAKFNAAARAKAAGPIVNDETAVVGHADLSRATPEAILDFLTHMVPNSLGEICNSQDQLQGWRDGLLAVGIKDVCFTLGPGTVLDGPRLGQMSWAIALPSPVQEKAVRTVLPLSEEEAKITDGVLAIPEWQKSLRPVEHPELAAAFEAAGDTAVQLILVLPADAKRVVSELMPELPKQLGGGPSSVLVRGICWASVGIDLPPHKALRLVVKSEDAKSAEALCAKLIDIARTGNQQAPASQQRPDFDKAIALLTPKVEGDRLVLIVDEKNSQAADEVMSVLMRPVEAAQQEEGRRQSVDNLKEIGLAMHNYYDEHKHLPLPASRSAEGKPLLSWRVQVLPHMGQGALYRQFHLDEPWDSPHNHTLIDKMPPMYRLPLSKSERAGPDELLAAGGQRGRLYCRAAHGVQGHQGWTAADDHGGRGGRRARGSLDQAGRLAVRSQRAGQGTRSFLRRPLQRDDGRRVGADVQSAAGREGPGETPRLVYPRRRRQDRGVVSAAGPQRKPPAPAGG